VDVRQKSVKYSDIRRHMDRHQQRLREIQLGSHRVGRTGINDSFRVELQKRHINNKKRIHEIAQSSKQNKIETENQQLLKKLVEISTG